MELHLIRHPRPDVAEGVCYGQTDLGLAESASAVAALLRPLLPPAYRLHASPLARARLLADELGTPTLDGRLKEMSFGDWEMVPFRDIGAAIDAWADDPLGFRAPGGESAHDMTARVRAWLDDTITPASDAPLVVVAHGGPLRVIAGHLLGIAPERWLALSFECGQVTRIDIAPWGAVLRWFNRSGGY